MKKPLEKRPAVEKRLTAKGHARPSTTDAFYDPKAAVEDLQRQINVLNKQLRDVKTAEAKDFEKLRKDQRRTRHDLNDLIEDHNSMLREESQGLKLSRHRAWYMRWLPHVR